MITGNLRDIDYYRSVIPYTAEISAFVQRNELPAVGEWLQISDSLRVIRLQDYNRTSDLLETHRKNYDLHVTLKGVDVMRSCQGFDRTTQTMNYDADKDYALYAGVPDAVTKLHANEFAFILPHEPHRNEFGEEGTEKLVFKILV
ncbi:YhcH/YjgK/YiaL family protein [Pseudochryseolinea flava]|uniref:YhcH/YjgK/YiaL family protein n=1 Tax=Pseudochryseolinea flava TaxID=2059302 RepID=A0A364Y343_9BACT|nr:YhcH/YjgK/YiaL family protein [Pseudochryseolinea flava]RAW01305.1 hypothetical protein DQQ10_10370 [Pseudochryseolinea flava]